MIISARREQSDGMNKLNLILTIPPSVNHCYKNFNVMGRRNRVLTPLARAWKEEAYYIANALAHRERWRMPEPEEKIVLEVVAFWPDGRRRDMNNTHKLLCDALEGALYLDDKMVLVRDMDFSVDRKRPRLEVCVYVKDD